MCYIITNLIKIFVIFISVGILVIINFQILRDLQDVQNGGSVWKTEPYSRTLIINCWCGTILTVLKLKDLCFLHWWLLMTLIDTIVAFVITCLQPEGDGFGMGEKLSAFFVIECMLVTFCTVACYARTLKAQQ